MSIATIDKNVDYDNKSFKGISPSASLLPVNHSMKEWCSLLNLKYSTVNKRFNRILSKCTFKSETRKYYYRQYAFCRAINYKQPWNNLVLPDIESLTDKLFFLLKEYLPASLSSSRFRGVETTRLIDNLKVGFTLEESVEWLLTENEIGYTSKFMDELLTKYLKEDLNTDSLAMLAYRYGQPPKLVKDRVLDKKWKLNKALNQVNY